MIHGQAQSPRGSLLCRDLFLGIRSQIRRQINSAFSEPFEYLLQVQKRRGGNKHRWAAVPACTSTHLWATEPGHTAEHSSASAQGLPNFGLGAQLRHFGGNLCRPPTSRRVCLPESSPWLLVVREWDSERRRRQAGSTETSWHSRTNAQGHCCQGLWRPNVPGNLA